MQLDEAHNIKERSSNTAKAAFELQSRYKWCLSGTPLQNRVGELYSLVRFLGGDPFSYYFCKFGQAPLSTEMLSLIAGKRCDCKSLHWKFTDKRTCDGEFHHTLASCCHSRRVQIAAIALCNMFVFLVKRAIQNTNLLVSDRHASGTAKS